MNLYFPATMTATATYYGICPFSNPSSSSTLSAQFFAGSNITVAGLTDNIFFVKYVLNFKFDYPCGSILGFLFSNVYTCFYSRKFNIFTSCIIAITVFILLIFLLVLVLLVFHFIAF